MRKVSMLLLCLLLVVNPAFTASAASSVTYDGSARDFIFKPGSKESPTDLFSNFKNVMPGDALTEEILVKNDLSRGVKIRVYMRSLGAQENTEEFLSQMNLTVQQRGDSLLFAAPADETAQLTDWVYLGTVYSGGEIVLDVTLNVPITMGSEFQNEIGYVDWQFKIEERPVDPSDPTPPKTGDTGNVILYTGIMVCSFAALWVLLLVRKRRK